jgi:hypothetical protein
MMVRRNEKEVIYALEMGGKVGNWKQGFSF